MHCKEFAAVLESEGSAPLSAEASEHLAACTACQDFLADLESIVAAARKIPAEAEPPARVWIALRAQLEAEGIIKEARVPAVASTLWESMGAQLRPRSWITAVAALAVVAAAVTLTRIPVKPHQPVTTNPVAVEPARPAQAPPALAATNSAPPASAHHVTAKAGPPAPVPSRVNNLAPSPSETAAAPLGGSQMDLNFPDMELAGNSQVDASLRQNLRTLNEFIAECEQHLKQHPEDQLAREYLYTAYQQKADLLAAMMDSGRSEH